MLKFIQSEPVMVQYAIHGAIGAACAFGLHWSGAQVAAVELFAAGILSMATRQMVTPIGSAK